MRRLKRKWRLFFYRNRKKIIIFLISIFLLILGEKMVSCVREEAEPTAGSVRLSEEEISARKPELEVDLLSINEYSRPGLQLEEVNNIVIHYTANPGATAKQNRDYFEGLKDSHTTRASSHFIVGLEGEIVQCIPSWEIAYASNDRNGDTISIECCHSDESGEFNEETYRSMVNLTSWLCIKFGLDSEDVIRHYDVTGKNCPKYFVEEEQAWEEFKEYVQKAIDKER